MLSHSPPRAINRWLALYGKIARRNAGEPDAGRFLLAWARAAGFHYVLPGASVWCFATPADRAWWGGHTDAWYAVLHGEILCRA